jgi:uncharacterized OB-fold protein
MTAKLGPLPGTALSEKDFADKQVLYVHDEMGAQFAWDTGIAIGSYLAGLKRGEIIGSRCAHCERTVVPPRVFCERCFQPMEEFVKLEDRGTVNTFSLCYVTWDVKRIKTPEIPAVIEIEGADELHGIMHKLGEVDPEKIEIGMQVQAVWKPAEEREGSITDIQYFKPVTEA